MGTQAQTQSLTPIKPQSQPQPRTHMGTHCPSHTVFPNGTIFLSTEDWENRSSQARRLVSVIPRDLISPEVQEKLEDPLSKRFMQQESGRPEEPKSLRN
ncbi:hypothetical protein Celaphus_00017178 [Cervus elaphus hippelaphus]|uniref:SPATA31 domain-containing protein n=1 Tax=Cervus elaphus hippelaphus TaxID=46360 RepID=A0A212CM22_CEREH|nr:hypothetical protein Celaphus_00017178 [Cervus elaphus hippelaphus]